MFDARAYRVLIATPSDVSAERQVVREVVHQWNDVHAADRRIVLLPVGWDTHAHPIMGERPQAAINKQVAKDCDLLVAVFWTRLGSPTGEAPSGTVEEIQEHIKAGKPAMIYFSDAPVHLGSVEEDQYRALREFREQCKRQGLIETYESISEFREKFGRQLTQLVLNQWGKSAPAEAAGDPDVHPEFGRWKFLVDMHDESLSPEARELLLEAAKSNDGTVMRLRTMNSGLSVSTNKRNFVESTDPRHQAKWDAAVLSLRDLGLLVDRRGKGEVFAMTNKGYETAERLASS